VSLSGVPGLPFAGLSVPAGAFATSAAVTPPTPITPIVGFHVAAANSLLVLSASGAPCMTALAPVTCAGGGLHGRAGLSGVIGVGLSGTLLAPLYTIPVPLGVVGGGGAAAGSNATTGGTIQLLGAGWTTGAATAFSSFNGAAFGAIMSVGGQSTTSGGRLALQAVTPVAIRTNLLPGLTLAGVARMRLVFVPEPATGLLLGLGVVGLGLIGRTRALLRRA